MGLVSHKFNQDERTTTQRALLVWLRGDAQIKTKKSTTKKCLGMIYYCKNSMLCISDMSWEDDDEIYSND
jgi:hypothetical protein